MISESFCLVHKLVFPRFLSHLIFIHAYLPGCSFPITVKGYVFQNYLMEVGLQKELSVRYFFYTDQHSALLPYTFVVFVDDTAFLCIKQNKDLPFVPSVTISNFKPVIFFSFSGRSQLASAKHKEFFSSPSDPPLDTKAC